jgi:hypothetical protein
MSKHTSPDTGRQKDTTAVNCFSCQHFHITYDPNFPYGCRAAGFKSRLLPSKEMYINSGLDCMLFEEKMKIR